MHISPTCNLCIFIQVQLSLDYPNTWCPHLIRMAEIFEYHLNQPRPSINHMQNQRTMSKALTNVQHVVLDIMHQWTEQGSKLYC